MSRSDVQCPYCHTTMQAVFILGNSYSLKWQPAAEPLILGIWASGHAIGTGGILSRPKAEGYRCPACSIIVVRG